MTARQLDRGLRSTLHDIWTLPVLPVGGDVHDDEEHSVLNADAMLRTLSEIRALPEEGD